MGFVGDGFGVAAGEDAVRYAVFDLVGVRYGVEVIEPDYLIEIIDSVRVSISQKRLDDVAELEFVVLAIEIFS